MTKRKMVSIRDDQDVFLEKHPGYSLSGIVQEAIDKIMESGE